MNFEDELAFFQSQFKDVKKIEQDKVVLKKTANKQVSEIRERQEKKDILFYFSDEYEPNLKTDDNDRLVYCREDVDHYLLKRLRRGDFQPEIFLDVHGLTLKEAKESLAKLLYSCEKEQIFCGSIMTGYGTFKLKNQLPKWLVQHPKIMALSIAPKKLGGDASFLFLFELEEDEFRKD